MENRIFKFLDIFYALVILSAIIWSVADSKVMPIAVPTVLILVGITFLFCNMFKDISIVAKIFFWISYNLFVPRSEKSHLIWGSIFGVFGVVSIFYMSGKKSITDSDLPVGEPLIQDYQDWWYKDPMLWIIIVLLVLIGLYRARSKKP